MKTVYTNINNITIGKYVEKVILKIFWFVIIIFINYNKSFNKTVNKILIIISLYKLILKFI